MSHDPRPVRSQLWECPQCTQRIVVHVRLTTEPVCANRQTHGTKAVVMVRRREQKA
jgi:DNA-directed RNA polymerase subunit RPC12/RpoP